MNSTEVVGFAFNADTFHAGCLINGWIAAHELSPAARAMDPAEVFEQYAEASALADWERMDSATFPQPIFAGEAAVHTCGGCGGLMDW